VSSIYRVNDDGSTVLADRVRAQNEERDLQRLIEKNLALLPGSDIDPGDPRRWLLIKREMPVPSPESGVNQWSLDLLLSDQDAIPTLVECKLVKNAEAHREILGQLLEYAANGTYYWTAEQLQRHAHEANGNFESAFEHLHSTSQSVDEYFEALVGNLRRGRVRLVFVLDEVPMRLKSTIKFLTGKMPDIQVLAVELQQFSAEGHRLVVPHLIGPSDIELTEASIANERRRVSNVWTESTFIAEVLTKHPEQGAAIKELIHAVQDLGIRVTYGTGKLGTVRFPLSSNEVRNVLSLDTDGKLWLNFWALNGEKDFEGEQWRTLEAIGRQDIGKKLPPDLRDKGPSVPFSDWSPALSKIIARLEAFASASQ